MITPAGKECPFFYGDYHRGQNREECRLLEDHNIKWSPVLCRTCPLPDTHQANSCEHMLFTPTIHRAFLKFRPSVTVTAFCLKSKCAVSEPKIGCGECHPILNQFVVGQNDNNYPS